MIDLSKGKYWDMPWSLISGCTPCSPGCENCWALGMEKRFRLDGPVTIRPERLDIPLWRKKPTVWAVWNDFFHEDVPLSFQSDAWRIMNQAYQHTFLVLTKRIENASKILSLNSQIIYPPNIWIGLTICNQQEANEKIPILLQISAAHKWISIEPMLGPIDLDKTCPGEPVKDGWCWRGDIDCVVLGGETGHGARMMNLEWAQNIQKQCVSAGVSFFYKGSGSYYYKNGFSRYLDGREWNELPWLTSNK